MREASSIADELARPAVTIGIPVYRPDVRTFEKCLESALGQSFEGSVEVLAVLDGAEENRDLLSSGVFDKFPEVRMVDREHGGEGSARNAIIDLARGEWLVFLDADDRLDERAVERLVACAQRYGADLVSSNHWRVYSEKRRAVDYFDADRLWQGDECDRFFDAVLSSGTDQGTVWGKAFSLDFLREHGLGFDASLVNGVDQEFMVRCVKCASCIVAIPDRTYFYVYSSGSVVRSFSPVYPDLLLATMNKVTVDLGLSDANANGSPLFNRYVLDRFLMLVINYLCHPEFDGGYAARRARFRGAISSYPYQGALANARLDDFSLSRRLVILCAQHGVFAPVRLVGWLRHRQLRGRG